MVSATNYIDICAVFIEIYTKMNPIETIQYNHKHASQHYDLIILVIASHNQHYAEFKKCWEIYAARFPAAKTFFLYSDPSIECDVVVDENTITHKHEEWYEPGILYKTFAGMHICNRLFTYNYVLRTNLSSFFHIPRLLQFLENQPSNDYAAAKQSIHREGLGFMSGAGFILSHDLVTYILTVAKTPNALTSEITNSPDDVAITMILERHLRVAVIFELTRYDCVEPTNPDVIPNDVFHIRNKTEWKYVTRDTDIENMRAQVAHFYGEKNRQYSQS